MANTYPNLTRALIRSSIGVVIFLIVAAMATGCMSTTISSGEAGVRYTPFGGTDLSQTYGEGLNVHAPWVSVIKYDEGSVSSQFQRNLLDGVFDLPLNVQPDFKGTGKCYLS